MALAMPGLGLAPLAFVALVPLFFALEGSGGFLAGFLSIAALFAVDLRWLLTLTRFSPWIAPAYVLVVAYLALFGGVFGLLTGRVRRGGRFDADLLLVAPALFTLLEILRAQGPLGLGFSSLYSTLYRFPPLIQLAALAGPWAITAAIVAVNTAVYLALRRRRRYAAVAIGLIGLLALLSALPIPKRGTSLKVGIVASDVPQEVKMEGEGPEELLAHYLSAGREAAAEGPDLIVFPESILPEYLLRETRYLRPFAQLALESGATLLIGTGDLRDGELYNSVALLSPTGEPVEIYDMVRPVPFGQVIPGRGLFEAIGLAPLVDPFVPVDVTPGRSFTPLEGLGTPICFESTFPAAARAFSRNGADLLVTVTNDAWFAGASELQAHFALSVFRAVENRRFFVQVANGGVSGVVDPRGRILLERTGAGTWMTTVDRRSDRSPYTTLGELPLFLAFAVAGAVFLAARIKGRPRAPAGPSGGRDPLAPSSSSGGSAL